MRISDWSSDVCSSDLDESERRRGPQEYGQGAEGDEAGCAEACTATVPRENRRTSGAPGSNRVASGCGRASAGTRRRIIQWPSTPTPLRSEEHTSALQSLMRIAYAVFC